MATDEAEYLGEHQWANQVGAREAGSVHEAGTQQRHSGPTELFGDHVGTGDGRARAAQDRAELLQDELGREVVALDVHAVEDLV